MESDAKLTLLSDNSFAPHPVSKELVTCSPTVDLSATVSGENVLHIRRSPGDIISKHTERGKVVEAIKWKADGEYHSSFPAGVSGK